MASGNLVSVDGVHVAYRIYGQGPDVEIQPDDSINLRNLLVEILTRELDVSEESLRSDESLIDFGLDSVTAGMIAIELGDRLNLTLPFTLLWDYPSIERLVACLSRYAGYVSRL